MAGKAPIPIRLTLALAVLLVTPVLAQSPGGGLVIIAPAWTAEPSPAAINAGWPRQLSKTSAGFAILRCTVGEGGVLNDCESTRDLPAQTGVGAAALNLTDQYRSAKPPGTAVLFPLVFNPDRPRLDQTDGGDVGLVRDIAAALTRPQRTTASLTVIACHIDDEGVVADCQTAFSTSIDPELAAFQIAKARTEIYGPATAAHLLANQTVYRVMTENTDRLRPERVNAPTPDAFYPARAVGGAIGKVRLACTITVTGLAKDCQVISESPAGQGFANAALQYAGRSTYFPTRIDGVEFEDQMTLDIRLAPAQEGPAPGGSPAPAETPDSSSTAGPPP